MIAYVARRLVGLLVVLLGVSALSFVFGAVAPGDPAQIELERLGGEPPTDEQVQRRRHELGLDRPLVVQYASWLGGAVRGDLGWSWSLRENVASVLAQRIPKTMELAVAAAALAVMLGVPLGAIAAVRQGSAVDHGTRLAALFAASFPSYFLGYVLILVFAVKLKVLPAFGAAGAANLVLPAMTLALGSAATLARVTRAAVLEVLGESYVQTAKAKGCSVASALFRHALRNALIPVVTIFGLSVGHLLGGVVIVESVFAWPGVGRLALGALQSRDYGLIEGVVLFAAVTYVLLNFLTDIAYAWLDPRIPSLGRSS